MTKRFIGYDFGEYENRNYAVYDLSKSEKTKEDFWDNEEECYDIWAFVDYLEENDCVLSCDDVVGLLNHLHQENQQLQEKQKHITHLESKIHRMREQIHKLEKLYHYRSADLKRENEQLKQEKESWKNIACQDLSKWSIFSKEVSVLHETRDIERFLEKYYEYCADMVMVYEWNVG